MNSPDWLERTTLLIKEPALQKLLKAHVCIVGMGGIGSFAAEFIARAGVGTMTIVDGDVVDSTNRNRQLPATFSTIGKSKVKVMAERLRDINPELRLYEQEIFLTPEQISDFLEEGGYDYVIDCIDSLKPKLTLIEQAYRKKIGFISCLGAGAKLDPSLVAVADISKSRNCRLAKYVRKRLKQRGISERVKVVYSSEHSDKSALHHITNPGLYKHSYYGTISYMPALFGLHAASWVIRKIIEEPAAQV
jgi:tRNA A37 threonylcarbamoyladenosine dehydratase